VRNTDWQDILACLDGDEEAFVKLVRRYETEITKLMWRFSRNPAVCEELIQNVFVEAYFSLKSYRGKAPFLYWLRKIAVRVGYKYWKEQAKTKVNISLDEFDIAQVEETDTIDSSAAAQILHELLARLSAADRLVLTLMYFEQCGTKEIAARMGWSRAMVKMRAFRARQKLRIIAESENLLEKLGWIR
jgi:RNA polymerase sigma-70 factor (ECF subfamily)